MDDESDPASRTPRPRALPKPSKNKPEPASRTSGPPQAALKSEDEPDLASNTSPQSSPRLSEEELDPASSIPPSWATPLLDMLARAQSRLDDLDDGDSTALEERMPSTLRRRQAVSTLVEETPDLGAALDPTETERSASPASPLSHREGSPDRFDSTTAFTASSQGSDEPSLRVEPTRRSTWSFGSAAAKRPNETHPLVLSSKPTASRRLTEGSASIPPLNPPKSTNTTELCGVISAVIGAVGTMIGIGMLTFGTWCGTYLDEGCDKTTNLAIGMIGNLLTAIGPIMVVLGTIHSMLQARRRTAKSGLDIEPGTAAG